MSTAIPPAASLPDLPLRDEPAILQRLSVMVRGAYRRQAWFMVLDADRVQFPLVMPMDLPPRPDRDPVVAFGHVYRTLGMIEGAAAIIVAYERPGPDSATGDDLSWLLGLAGAIGRADLPVHGPYFATETGVRRWESHHDAARTDVVMQEWPHEDDDHADPGGTAARRASDA